VVPELERERSRFGTGEVGAFAADEAVVRAADAESRQARLRPWLLWGVLIAGVAGLGALVWRLAQSSAAAPPAA